METTTTTTNIVPASTVVVSTPTTPTTSSTTSAAAAAANVTPKTAATAQFNTTTALILAARKIFNRNSNNDNLINSNSNLLLSTAVTTTTATITSASTQPLGAAVNAEKSDDANNVIAVSSMSEGQRSRWSGAPSASSSPILSQPRPKIYERNANGTMVATARPDNEAETQLFRVLQRGSLLSYFDTFLEMGGDDVQQLYEAGEQEFLEIMSLVGMASKPLHVRRLQKALHQWSQNPLLFKLPVMNNTTPGLCETAAQISAIFNTEPSSTLTRNKFQNFSPTPVANLSFHPISTETRSSPPASFLTHMGTPTLSVPAIQQQQHQPSTISLAAASSLNTVSVSGTTVVASTAHQVSSSSPQLTPVLSENQVRYITMGAEKIARQLPAREPRLQTSKKRTSRELEQIIAMNDNDPRRMDEIRKYSAIYGRFDCKRRPEKPLTMHEVCVNEAAAQLCRRVPALLTRRDELFPLARQIVKDAGFGHATTLSRYGGLLPQTSSSTSSPMRVNTSTPADCESSDTADNKRQRLSSDNVSTAELSRDSADDSRYNLFAMYQKFAARQTFELDINKHSFSQRSDIEDNDNSRFSFTNPDSEYISLNGAESERDTTCDSINVNNSRISEVHSTASTASNNQQTQNFAANFSNASAGQTTTNLNNLDGVKLDFNSTRVSGVRVISTASTGHIIAVANPALILSPALNEPLNVKRKTDSSDL